MKTSAPFQGFSHDDNQIPRALPWAYIVRPVGANWNWDSKTKAYGPLKEVHN